MSKNDLVFLAKIGGLLLLAICIIGGGIALYVHNVRECHAHGFSWLFCLTALGR